MCGRLQQYHALSRWSCYWLHKATQPCRICVCQRTYPFLAIHSRLYVQEKHSVGKTWRTWWIVKCQQSHATCLCRLIQSCCHVFWLSCDKILTSRTSFANRVKNRSSGDRFVKGIYVRVDHDTPSIRRYFITSGSEFLAQNFKSYPDENPFRNPSCLLRCTPFILKDLAYWRCSLRQASRRRNNSTRSYTRTDASRRCSKGPWRPSAIHHSSITLFMREFVSGPPSYRSIQKRIRDRKPSLRESLWAVSGCRTEFFEKWQFFLKQFPFSAPGVWRALIVLLRLNLICTFFAHTVTDVDGDPHVKSPLWSYVESKTSASIWHLLPSMHQALILSTRCLGQGIEGCVCLKIRLVLSDAQMSC